jgi:ABC-2 type transport system permease protein
MSIKIEKQLVALQTILNKEIVRFMRIWSQTILPPAITMTLYFIIFGKMIGSQIHNVNGYSYMQYIVPGLTMMAIMTNSYANTASSFFGAKFSKSIEEMLVSPMPNYIIMLGFMLGGTLRGILVGIVVIFISLFFTHLHIQNIGIVIAMAILASMLFALGGLVNAIFAKKFDDVSFIPTFVLTPLTYLGGVFYSIKQLPPIWQKLSMLNPILNVIDTFRYGMLGVSDVNIYFGFSLVCGLFIVLFIWCLSLMNKGTGLRS